MSPQRDRSDKKSRWSTLCSQLGEDDGVDPRRVAHPQRKKTVDRKTLQLCGQVAHIIESVLNGDLRDDDLSGLHVVSVVPTAHASRLLVTVAPGPCPPAVSAETILSKLQAQSRRIRAEVSTAITRRKTPELVFVYVPVNLEYDSQALDQSEAHDE